MKSSVCSGCAFNNGWCNRLVIAGGMGRHDRVASDYLKGDTCEYRLEGNSEVSNKPNFENS